MASNGSVMSRIRMFEANSDHPEDVTDRTPTKVHPFNRSEFQASRDTESPHRSSPRVTSAWNKFADSPSTKASPVWDNRDDTNFEVEDFNKDAFTVDTGFSGRSPHTKADPMWGTGDFSGRDEPEQETFEFAQNSPSLTASEEIEAGHQQGGVKEWTGTESIDNLAWPPVTTQPDNIGQTLSLESSQEESRVSLSDSRQFSNQDPSWSKATSTVSETPSELKRNLDAASVVMQEERASSIGSSSASSRSSLSADELGSVAKQALKLSKIQAQTRKSRLKNSPLHQMLLEKRTRKYVVEDMVQPIQTHTSETVPSPKNATMRRSARLSRVEKYASKSRYSSNRDKKRFEDDASTGTSASVSQQVEKVAPTTHPVFGYTQKSQTSTQGKAGAGAGAVAVATTEPSSLKRSNEETNASVQANEREVVVTSNSMTSTTSRHNLSRSERAKALKRVIPSSKIKPNQRDVGVGDKSDKYAFHADEIMLAANDSTFESNSDNDLDENWDKARSESPTAENSMLLGEGIAQMSSGDSALNWSVTTGSASGTTPHTIIHTSSNSKISSGESASNRLDTIIDEDAREEAVLTYTDTSSSRDPGRELQSLLAANRSSDNSSSRSGMKPDALRWWQKNYGKKVTGATNHAVRNAFSRLSPNNGNAQQEQQFFRIEGNEDEDEEDDVFFGIEEADARFHHPVVNGPLREAPEQFSSEEDIGIPAPAFESEDPTIENESKGEVSLNTPPLPDYQPLLESKRVGPNDRCSGMVISDVKGSGSVTSDMTSSIIAGKNRKSSWYRPDLVHTIREEPVEDDKNALSPPSHADSTDDEHTTDETEAFYETVVDSVANTTNVGSTTDSHRMPTGAVLLGLGCAFVDSFSNACQVPDAKHVRQPAAECASKTKETCEIERRHDCDAFRDDGTYGTRSTYAHATTVSGPSLNTLNEEERRLWSEWDKRDRHVNINEPAERTGRSADLSPTDTLQRKEVHEKRRQLAQQKLLEHAEQALALYGVKNEVGIVATSDENARKECAAVLDVSENNAGGKPSTTPVVSPSNRSILSVLSQDQRNVLEQFSSTLKNDGFQVLKLNRRNKWQIRFLTVSREVTWLNSEEMEDIGQCPKALLWLKRFKGLSYGMSNIKKQGRGGILFAELRRVDTVSLRRSARTIPKRLKTSYDPENACVSLNYSFEGGDRSVILCFKSSQDADVFCAAMKIIKDVLERNL